MNFQKGKLVRFCSAIRWRLIIFRYGWALFDFLSLTFRYPSYAFQYKNSFKVGSEGFVEIDELQNILPRVHKYVNQYYCPTNHRLSKQLEHKRGSKPFVNLLDLPREANTSSNGFISPILELAFSSSVISLARDYLGKNFSINSIQILYSFAANSDALVESQYWHKDYNSSKSLHFFIPITNMSAEAPFYICSPDVSAKIPRRPWVRRISPTMFQSYTNNWHNLLLDPFSCIALDPAICYHRYSSPRDHVAIFITFNSHPLNYSQDQSLTPEIKRKLLKIACSVNSAHTDEFWKSMFRIKS